MRCGIPPWVTTCVHCPRPCSDEQAPDPCAHGASEASRQVEPTAEAARRNQRRSRQTRGRADVRRSGLAKEMGQAPEQDTQGSRVGCTDQEGESRRQENRAERSVLIVPHPCPLPKREGDATATRVR